MSDLTEVREMYLAEVRRAEKAETERDAAAQEIVRLTRRFVTMDAKIDQLEWAPQRSKAVADLCAEATDVGVSLVRRPQEDLKVAGIRIGELSLAWAKHVESAVVEIRSLGDELKALKIADAHRTVALNGACFVISVLAGERYDHGLGDNYSEEIVDAARKRLEGIDD